MAQIIGKYEHERSENIDEFFRSLGVPYVARKMMSLSNPRLEISRYGDQWTIKNTTMIRTQTWIFVLGSEYEETMPNGDVLKNTTTLEDDSLITVSVRSDGNKVIRKYNFTEQGAVLTMSYEQSDQIAKRYFKRVE